MGEAERSRTTAATKANNRDAKLTHDAPKFVWLQKQQQQQESRSATTADNNNINCTTTTTSETTTTFSLLGKDEGCLYQADLTLPTTVADDSGSSNHYRRNKNNRQHHQELLLANSSSSNSSSRSRLCVGIYDKQTHTLTLHPTAGSGSVWALQQSVPAYSSNIVAKSTEQTTSTAAAEHKRALFDDFGSSKKQRALRSQEANRVHLEQVVGNKGMASVFLTTDGGGEQQLDGNIMSESNRKAIEEQRHLDQQQQLSTNNNNPSNMVANTTIEAATQEWRRGFLPKYNSTTHDPYRIYDPKDMVSGSEDAWSHICRVVDACCQQDCRAFEASWEARVAAEVDFLRGCGARAVLGDIPALPFEAASRAGVPSLALGNFSWDWIYRHLSARQPSLAGSAARAAAAYATVGRLLELPFAAGLEAFPVREAIGMVARRPRVERAEARRRLGLDARPAVLVTFGGIGLPGLSRAALEGDAGLRWLLPDELSEGRLEELGLGYPDLVGAADAVVTKPGYGIVTDAIGAGTPLVYTERGDFPEYAVMVAELPRYLASVHLSNAEVRAGRIGGAVRRVLELPMPPPPPLDGAARAAARVLEALG